MSNQQDKKDTRTFILSGKVCEKNVSEIIHSIQEINYDDQYRESVMKDYQPQPISVIVNSGGGYVYDGWGLVGCMECSSTPIYTICYGSAMSMALAIFLAGHQRYAHRFATFMYHEIYGGNVGKLEEVKDTVTEMNRLQNMYDRYILERTNILQDTLDRVRKDRTDWFITAEDAVKLGIANDMLG